MDGILEMSTDTVAAATAQDSPYRTPDAEVPMYMKFCSKGLQRLFSITMGRHESNLSLRDPHTDDTVPLPYFSFYFSPSPLGAADMYFLLFRGRDNSAPTTCRELFGIITAWEQRRDGNRDWIIHSLRGAFA